MKIIRYLCLLFWLSTLCIGCSNTSTSSRDNVAVNPEQIALADSILSCLQQEQFDKIVDHFDENLKMQLNKEQLAVVWAQLNTQFGKYSRNEFYKAEKIDAVGNKIIYQCYFGNKKLYFQLVLGKENRIIGLFFTHQLT